MGAIREQKWMEDAFLRLSLRKITLRNVLWAENEVFLYIELQRHKIFHFIHKPAC